MKNTPSNFLIASLILIVGVILGILISTLGALRNTIKPTSQKITTVNTAFAGEHSIWTHVNGAYSFEYPSTYQVSSPAIGIAEIPEIIYLESTGKCTPGTAENSTTRKIGSNTAYYFFSDNAEIETKLTARFCGSNGDTVFATYPKKETELAEKILSTLRY